MFSKNWRYCFVKDINVIRNCVGTVSEKCFRNSTFICTGVNLSFHKPVPAGEVVNYTATVFPRCAREHVDYFSWIFTQPPIITRGNNPTLQYVHRRSGSHFVTVIAHNCHGNATAVPMRVHVIARLAGLRLEALGDNLVNESIEFIAFTYQGDGLQFHWTFGDRSKRLTTQDTLVNHTYSR